MSNIIGHQYHWAGRIFAFSLLPMLHLASYKLLEVMVFEMFPLDCKRKLPIKSLTKVQTNHVDV